MAEIVETVVTETVTVRKRAAPVYLKGVYCPRCDREYANMALVIEHVEQQHPDHDPSWHDTYPEGFGN